MVDSVVEDLQLSTWEASDIQTEHLERHRGPILRQVGVQICKRDIFQLFQDDSLTSVPSVVIIACICPPMSVREQLDGLLFKYLRRRVDATERRIMYDSLAFESAVGQLPNATVVSISRRSDWIRATSAPAAVVTMRPVPGYTPTQCHHGPDELLRPLGEGHDLVARISTRGPLNPAHYEESNGSFNLVTLCYQATLKGWRVLFTGQWDGSLCHGCALGVLASLPSNYIPRNPEPRVAQPFALKVMGGYTGVYAEYFDYARDRRVQTLLSERLRRLAEQAEECEEWPVQELQPHVNINTAVMWLFATAIGVSCNERASVSS